MTLKATILTDIDLLLNADEFAEAFTFSRSGLSIDCIFDDTFRLAATEDTAVSTSAPQLLAKNTDVTGIIKGDTLTRAADAVVYNVVDTEPLPTGGMTIVILSQN